MIWDGAHDYDDDRAPGPAADLVCLMLLAANIAGWSALIWILLP